MAVLLGEVVAQHDVRAGEARRAAHDLAAQVVDGVQLREVTAGELQRHGVCPLLEDGGELAHGDLGGDLRLGRDGVLDLCRVVDRTPLRLRLHGDLGTAADGLVHQAVLQPDDQRAQKDLHADAHGDTGGDEDGLHGALAQEADGDAETEHRSVLRDRLVSGRVPGGHALRGFRRGLVRGRRGAVLGGLFSGLLGRLAREIGVFAGASRRPPGAPGRRAARPGPRSPEAATR